MAAKKRSTAKKATARVDTTGVVVTNDHLVPITHVARMQQVLAENPNHSRADEYADAITQYRAVWAGYSPAVRAAAAEAAESIHDMTPGAVASAVSTLED